jgi:hypothetical protein
MSDNEAGQTAGKGWSDREKVHTPVASEKASQKHFPKLT